MITTCTTAEALTFNWLACNLICAFLSLSEWVSSLLSSSKVLIFSCSVVT